MSVEASFLTGANAAFVAELYDRYLSNPSSVDPSWSKFFDEMGDDGAAIASEVGGPSWAEDGTAVIGVADPDAVKESGKKAAPAAPATLKTTEDSIHAIQLIRAYRMRGHTVAKLDPLDLQEPDPHPELDIHTHGFTEDDLDREIYLGGVLGLEKATLRHILQVVTETYCGTIGLEYTHVQDPAQKAWLQARIEGIRNQTDFTDMGKKAILERLTEAEGFEKFLGTKYTGTKRFGLDGGEAAVPALEQILKVGGRLGVEQVVLGMAHRGRLNVLVNVMHKPFTAIFSEFQGNSPNPDDVEGSGDVKYHLGTSADREFDGHNVHLSLTANPSHLEVVDPVVLGKVRAKQEQMDDVDRKKCMALLIHGDAAFAGQGVVAECFGLSQVEGYTTGGTIHFIINNQIGFTTTPQYSRSGLYCTEVAKMVEAPIFHINADDPEAVVHAARIAMEFRQEFGVDVVIDMICYRRHGHNEGDEPKFTQPLMYDKIDGHPSTRAIYAERLVSEGLMTQEEADMMMSQFLHMMEVDFDSARSYKPNKADWLEGAWKGLDQIAGEEEYMEHETGAPIKTLKAVGKALTTVPDGVDVNSKIVRQLKAKAKMFDSGEGIDWATAEALAFGSLLTEGTPVRLSGQDCGRGTFSQRHSVLHDQKNENRYVPLNNIQKKQANFEVIDSVLSELSVLGYEYGYSLAEPRALVMWEAQFGDFSNGAQMIIDQFINSGESKWLRMSGLVMLLPHGYEGQGPEHSSARFERFLQMSAEDNWQVCNLTTPANYFHALRRQVHREFRKPLVIMTPKSLLRHKLCISSLDDLGPNGQFQRVIPETKKLVAATKVKRVVLCTGKVYYDLLQAREEADIKDVAIIRVEQLYPWPKDTIVKEIKKYKNAEVVWCQEEPANMGAWTFVDRRLEFALEDAGIKCMRPLYAGRPPAASPATGLMKAHVAQQNQLVEDALIVSADELNRRAPFRRMTKLSLAQA